MQEKNDHDLIREIHTAIFGVGGQGGCFRSCAEHRRDYYIFKRWVIGIACFLAGSGLLGIGITELVKSGLLR